LLLCCDQFLNSEFSTTISFQCRFYFTLHKHAALIELSFLQEKKNFFQWLLRKSQNSEKKNKNKVQFINQFNSYVKFYLGALISFGWHIKQKEFYQSIPSVLIFSGVIVINCNNVACGYQILALSVCDTFFINYLFPSPSLALVSYFDGHEITPKAIKYNIIIFLPLIYSFLSV
jgi:hypothetical protein